MPRRAHALVPLAIAAALTGTPAAAVQRAFVASFGSDANTTTNCGLANPCRSFAAAVPVVDSGGEVVALDSIGYGVVTIDRSITLTAAPGTYAGISVSAGGTGVTIATPGVNVTLRGLTINNVGGAFGVNMTDGSRLSIENCVISNFSSTGGFAVSAVSATVRIIDSLIRDNYNGVQLFGFSTGDIVNSKFLGHTNQAILVHAAGAATVTSAEITDSVVSGNVFGITSRSVHPGTTTKISVIRAVVTNNSDSGLLAQSDTGGPALIAISDSMVTGNSTGLRLSGAGAVVEAFGNNTVRQNGVNTVGVITPVSPL